MNNFKAFLTYIQMFLIFPIGILIILSFGKLITEGYLAYAMFHQRTNGISIKLLIILIVIFISCSVIKRIK
jgi:hypothetical protein